MNKIYATSDIVCYLPDGVEERLTFLINEIEERLE